MDRLFIDVSNKYIIFNQFISKNGTKCTVFGIELNFFDDFSSTRFQNQFL